MLQGSSMSPGLFPHWKDRRLGGDLSAWGCMGLGGAMRSVCVCSSNASNAIHHGLCDNGGAVWGAHRALASPPMLGFSQRCLSYEVVGCPSCEEGQSQE